MAPRASSQGRRRKDHEESCRWHRATIQQGEVEPEQETGGLVQIARDLAAGPPPGVGLALPGQEVLAPKDLAKMLTTARKVLNFGAAAAGGKPLRKNMKQIIISS